VVAGGSGRDGGDDIRGLRNEIHNTPGEIDTKSTTPMSSQDDSQSRDGSFVGVLQCVAVWCSVSRTVNLLHIWAARMTTRDGSFVGVLQCVAVCCSVLQCVAVSHEMCISYIYGQPG